MVKKLFLLRKGEGFRFSMIALLMFTILLNQNIVRNLKDALAVTCIGAESLSFIKLWIEVPFGIFFVFVYTKLCSMLHPNVVFRYVVIFFLLYFAIFLFILFPNSVMLQPDALLVKHYVHIHPHWKWFIMLWAQWIIVSFYVLGELWPIIVFSILFWQFVNNIITSTNQASRFYPSLSFFGQSNLIISSFVIQYVTNENLLGSYLFSGDTFTVKIKMLLGIVLISGIACLLLHKYIEILVTKGKPFGIKIKKRALIKLGIFDSLNIVLSSPHLWMICILIISYSLSINLIEGLWFFEAKKFYSSTIDFMRYGAKISFWIGIITLVFSLIGGYILRILGWFYGALLTPLTMLIFGSIFFICVLCQSCINSVIFKWGISTSLMLVIVGGIQNTVSKGIKYSIFDSTKEMAYIPLDDMKKTQGKAAAEILGAKLGKASGSIVQSGIFFLFPRSSYNDIAGVLLTIFILVMFIWIINIYCLNKSYMKLKQANNL